MTTSPASAEHDVLVVGGGPTGMLAAGDLAAAGRRVLVVERWPRPNPTSRAFAVMPRTLELLAARGLVDELLPPGALMERVALFAGVELDLTDVRSRFRGVFVTPQTNVDALLARYAERRGAEILRGEEAVDLAQDADGVTVTTRPKDGGAETRRRARWLVGTDGSHSTVRRLVGAGFPGRTVLTSMVLADVVLDHGPRADGLSLAVTPTALSFLAPYGDGRRYRLMVWDREHQLPDTAAVDDDEIRAVLRATRGDVGLREITWRSRFHSEERQVRDYRHGRVLLAGDAAHVHSPMGGQGMNTGIQDAGDLAWRLDAVLGGAPEATLGDYQRERHPIGARVVRQSGAMMRSVTLGPAPARALRDLLAPLLLRSPALHDVIAGGFAGTELRYRRPRGAARDVGRRAWGIPLDDGRDVVELEYGPRFTLVLERDAEVPIVTPDGVAVARRTDAGPAVLVRPDGMVGWVGASAGGGYRAALLPVGTARPAPVPRAR